MIFLILTHYPNSDWVVWYADQREGFRTYEEAERRIAENGDQDEQYHIVKLDPPLAPRRTVVAVPESDNNLKQYRIVKSAAKRGSVSLATVKKAVSVVKEMAQGGKFEVGRGQIGQKRTKGE